MFSLDLRGIPVIDTHAHLCDIAWEERDLSAVFSLSLEDPPPEQRRHTLFYRWFLQELSRFLDCPSGEETVLARRRERAAEDYPGYVRALFEQARIEGLVVDTGYKPAAVSLEDFTALVPAEVRFLFRIESVVDPLWEERPPFNQALDFFTRAVERALEDRRFAGLKSIIGYRTGIGITAVTEEEARRAYGAGREKEVRDFFLRLAWRFCLEKDLPFQLHTSFGESNCDLALNNPLLLKPFLREEEYRNLRLVLVHGGYPYTFETGYLCAMHPSLYCDVSEFVPLVPLGMKKGLADLLDMCPFNKIMYGSDAFILPEFYWFAAVAFRQRLAELLREMVERGMCDTGYARAVAEKIMHRNAASVYGFPSAGSGEGAAGEGPGRAG